MVEKPSKLQPALLGGLVLGLGSVIPGLSYGNLCCCGWALVAGALAASLLIRRSPVFPIKSGDGAAAGAFAGVVGSSAAVAVSRRSLVSHRFFLSRLLQRMPVDQVEQREQEEPDDIDEVPI